MSVHVSVIVCILVWTHVHVCVAPPIVVGAWLMAGTYGGFLIIIMRSCLHNNYACSKFGEILIRYASYQHKHSMQLH